LSDDKKSRLRRVVDLRNREYERCVQALSEARRAEEQALIFVEQAKKKAESALVAQKELALVGTSAVDWAEMNSWLLSQQRGAQLASDERHAASHAVLEAREKVKGAQTQLYRIETLIERMVDEERQARERMGRKMDDEVAARQAAAQRKSGSHPTAKKP
jgi:flagellar biosynthesis chaperone FliJ